MKSRLDQDKVKQSRRRNIILVLAAILVLLLGLGSWKIHQTLTYTSQHFNQNVRIYCIQVGGLTIKQAKKKINQQSKNTAVLRNGRIKLQHVANLQAIDTATTKRFFNQQHTSFPSNDRYRFASASLHKLRQALLAFKRRQVTYKINGRAYKLPAALIKEVAYANGHYQLLQTGDLEQRLHEIADENDTFHQSYDFVTPTGSKIRVTNQSYGWGIWQSAALKAIKKAFDTNQAQVDGRRYLYGQGFSTAPHGYGKSNHGLGQTYIVVSIGAQKAWFYRGGRKVLAISDLVTGTQDSTTGDATPKGVWYIMYKQSPSTLKGKNDDGSSYSSPVKYWMPFTLSGCGFHDASWRTDWSKTAYLKGGSHGCINIKPSEIRSVWDVVETGEPVIIY